MTTNAPRNNRKISNVIPPPTPPPKKTGYEEIIGRIKEIAKLVKEQSKDNSIPLKEKLGIKILKDAGILDDNFDLTEQYKPLTEQYKPIYFTETPCSNCYERLCLKHGEIENENENGIEIYVECENCKQTNKFVINKRTKKESCDGTE